MSEDEELSNTLTELKKLSSHELNIAHRTAVLTRKILNFLGVATFLSVMIWPSIFSFILGFIAIYLVTNLSMSADLVLKQIKKIMESIGR